MVGIAIWQPEERTVSLMVSAVELTAVDNPRHNSILHHAFGGQQAVFGGGG